MMASAAARKSFVNYFGGGAGGVGGGGAAERVDDDNLEAELDFDESDVWDSNTDAAGKVLMSDQANKKSMLMNKNSNSSRPLKKPTRKTSSGGSFGQAANHRSTAAAAAARPATSLPVNVPDWSRILGDEYKSRGNNGRGYEDDVDYEEDGGDDEDEDGRLPPHEYLAARMRSGWSFSVHEGIGRTLKGRDLSRVRNAVWKQTGFED